MSYILDALRKLEREQPSRIIPRLMTAAEIDTPAVRRAWLWPIVGGVAVLVNIILFAVLLWPTPPAREAPEAIASAPAAGGATPTPAIAPTTAVATAPTAPDPARAAVGGAPSPSEAAQRSVPTAVPPGPAPGAGGSAAPSGVASARSGVATAPSGPTPASGVGTPTPGGAAPTPSAGAAARTGIVPPVSGATPAPGVGPAPSSAASGRAPATSAAPPGAAVAPRRPAEPSATAKTPALGTPENAPVPPPPSAKPADGTVATGSPAGVPRLRLEVLVYSDTPAERFVFINGRKYLEGQTVDGGVTLERIEQNGAVLSHEGQRFVLRE